MKVNRGSWSIDNIYVIQAFKVYKFIEKKKKNKLIN